ncbi:predicted protein [Naegleria gruberi]|uniref:Predicted protein n=1 Tax=Naegleria gruberi TaxID=5762 RepID=D2VTS4_NAEGR|nr:uncharacterized protein NAEGRDRAFT_59196 [Naegleria gruberi]EFC39775.1 predicted protein [Naegleria gruberi]|eukprot:XP_002672519.1 predicted protein [Naegleria gruberi strain NEG-M]
MTQTSPKGASSPSLLFITKPSSPTKQRSFDTRNFSKPNNILNEYKFQLPLGELQTIILSNFLKDVSHSFTLPFDDFLDRGFQDSFVQLFHEFLELEQNVMTLKFIFKLDEFKLLKSAKNRFKLGHELVDIYVKDCSANQLNLPNHVKENFMKEFAKCSIKETPVTIFDPIFSHIHYSLGTDNYMRFVGSDLYAKFVLDQSAMEFRKVSKISINQVCDFLERFYIQMGCRKMSDNLSLSDKLVQAIQDRESNQVSNESFEIEGAKVCSSPKSSRAFSPNSEDTESYPYDGDSDFKSSLHVMPSSSKVFEVLESVMLDGSGIVQDKHYTLFKMLHQDEGIWHQSGVNGETTSYYTELNLKHYNSDSKRKLKKEKFKIFKETGIVKASTDEVIRIMFDSYFSKEAVEETSHIDYVQGDIYSCIISQLCVKKNFPLTSRYFHVGLSARDETLHEWHIGKENKNQETFSSICNSKQSSYWIARLPIHNSKFQPPKGHTKGSLFGGSYIERISNTECRYSMMIYFDMNSFLPLTMWKSNKNSKSDLISNFNELVRERREQSTDSIDSQTINTIIDYRKNIGNLYGFTLN